MGGHWSEDLEEKERGIRNHENNQPFEEVLRKKMKQGNNMVWMQTVYNVESKFLLLVSSETLHKMQQ